MKSSTLHRSNLSREKMSMIENVKPEYDINSSLELDRYIKQPKKPELDVLWRDFEKSVQSKSRAKAPIVYLAAGFVFGLIAAIGIAFIVGISTYSNFQNQNTNELVKQEQSKIPVTVVPTAKDEKENIISSGEEKYTIKAGDTLDKIVYRFYGVYSQEKIDKIMQLNNIKDETTIQIGQVLTIPLD